MEPEAKREAAKPADEHTKPRQWPFNLGCMLVAVGFSLPYFGGADMEFAMENAEIWRGELWRFLLAPFVHGDVLHLAGNVYWIAQFGQPIEHRCRPALTALLFAILCLGSGAPEFLVTGVGGIGLSGVVYGYFGLLYAARRRHDPLGDVLDKRTIAWFAVWTVLCIGATLAEVWAIGNIAHLAGAVFGCLIGCALGSSRQRRWLTVIGCATAVLTACTLYMPWESGWWWARAVRQFDDRRPNEAYASLEAGLARVPDESAAGPFYFNLAVTADALGDFQKAVTWFERAISVSDEPNNVRTQLAYTYFRHGRADRAREILRDLKPDDIDASIRDDAEFMQLMPSGE
ncbi:MAG: rhomboid family intramembrane serine protease [Phycisphaerae bacterium]